MALKTVPYENNSIDEMMVPWKGKFSGIKQYIRGKPYPWGFKIWARTTTCGLLCDFEVYQGQSHVRPKENNKLGIAANVILYLCKTIPSHVGFHTKDIVQLNIPTKDDIIFRKFQCQVSASHVCVNVIMKPGRPFLDVEDNHASPLHKYTTYFNTPRLKHYLQQRPLHNKHSHRPPPSHYNRYKNKHAPYTYIYCL